MNKTLYKRLSTGKIQQWTVDVIYIQDEFYLKHGWNLQTKVIYTFGQLDGKQQVKEVTYKLGKNLGKSNETTPYEQAILDAESDVRKKMTSGYVEDINSIDDIDKVPKVMLAHEYLKHSSKVEKYDYVYMQTKIDGFRCIANIVDGRLYTRSRKEILTMPHISDAVTKLRQDHTNSFMSNIIWLDGELFVEGISFQKLSSIIRKSNHPKYNIIKYHIFDVIVDKLMKQRVDILSYIDVEDPLVKVFTHQVPIREIDSYHQMFIRNGYEGSMIRLPDYKYEHKRSYGLLKLKDFYDKEYKIIGVEKEKGKNTLGAFVLIDIHDNSIIFRARPSITHNEKDYIWKHQDGYIGKEVTVKYQELHHDTGIPRFPVVIKIHLVKGKD